MAVIVLCLLLMLLVGLQWDCGISWPCSLTFSFDFNPETLPKDVEKIQESKFKELKVNCVSEALCP